MTTKRPYAQSNAKRRNLHITEENFQALRELGNGNASAGIRKAIEIIKGKDND
jgi:hypothetical protein